MSTNIDDMKQIQQRSKGRKLNLKIKLIIITQEMNNEIICDRQSPVSDE